MEEIPENINRTITDLLAEIKWLERVIKDRIHKDRMSGFAKEGAVYVVPSPPALESSDSSLATFIKDNNLGLEERALLMLSLAPHLQPELLEQLIVPRMASGMEISSEISNPFKCVIGTRGEHFKGLLPTGLTYLYILSGQDLKERLRLQYLLSGPNALVQKGVILLEPHLKGEPIFSGRLIIAENYLEKFTFGEVDKAGSLKYSILNEQNQ